jgi:hypothetical protein
MLSREEKSIVDTLKLEISCNFYEMTEPSTSEAVPNNEPSTSTAPGNSFSLNLHQC